MKSFAVPLVNLSNNQFPQPPRSTQITPPNRHLQFQPSTKNPNTLTPSIPLPLSATNNSKQNNVFKVPLLMAIVPLRIKSLRSFTNPPDPQCSFLKFPQKLHHIIIVVKMDLSARISPNPRHHLNLNTPLDLSPDNMILKNPFLYVTPKR